MMISKFINLHKIILLLQLFLISRLFEIFYKIDNLNYLIILLVYLYSLLVYWFYKDMLKGFTYKIFFTGSILVIFLILKLCNIEDAYTIIYNIFIDNFTSIRSLHLNSLPIDFMFFLPFLIVIIPIATSTIFYFKDRLPCITLILTLCTMYFLGYDNLIIKSYTSIYIILSCLELGINIYDSNLRKAKKNNYKFIVPIKNNNMYIAIMVVLIASFTILAGETFGVKSIKKFRNDRITTKINEVNSVKNAYTLNYSGYGNNSYKLGGPIQLNYNLALKVKSSKPMYLRGSALDYYDGFRWTNDIDDYHLFNTKSKSKLVKSDKIEITPQSLITSTFLTPLNTLNIEAKNSNIMYNDYNIFIVGNKIGVESRYTVEYALIEDKKINDDDFYKKEVNEKYKKYLQLPDNITPKTYSLVWNLLKDCKNNEEKISKINKYLTENYKYSLQVNNVPSKQEFLDYFLFKEKKGYCTYFATAATIFARIAGIPARYVEGFNMDNITDANGFYLVGNNNAHAWTEILTSPSEDSWRILDCTPGYSESEQQNKIPVLYSNVKDVEINDNLKTVKNFKIPIINVSYLIWIIIFVLILLILVLVFIRLRRWIRNKNKILSCDGVIPIYYYSKKRLSTIGITWSNSLSDEEGALELKDEILKKHFIEIVKVFYEEYYGSNIDTSFNKVEFYKYLEGHIRKKSRFFKYYFNKFK